MKRKLLTQMCHEWRGNLALVIELWVVSVVLWFIADGFYAHYKVVWGNPTGTSIENVWVAKVATVPEGGFDYNAADSTTDNAVMLQSIIDRMKSKPFVSAIATELYAKPYTYSSMSTSLTDAEFPDSVVYNYCAMIRYVSPDFIKVFDILGPDGETPDQLMALIENRQTDILVSSDIITSRNSYYGHDGTLVIGQEKEKRNIIGRRAYLDDNGNTMRIVGFINPMKRSDVEMPIPTTLLFKDPSTGFFTNEMNVVFKVDPGRLPDASDPLSWFSTSELRAGNVYLTNIRPMSLLKEQLMQGSDTARRNYLVLLGFLVITVFIGILGSFWVRTASRTQEVAIRKAAGACNADIFRRFISEGLLLLVVVTPLALVTDWWLAHEYFNIPAVEDPFVRGIGMAFGNVKSDAKYITLSAYFTWPRLLLCASIVFSLLAVMVIAATFVPARRAMKIQPAEALHAD